MTAIDTLAAALYAACLRDLPGITYGEIDYSAERQYLNTLSYEQKIEYHKAKAEIETQPKLVSFFAARGIPYREKIRRPSPERCEVTMFSQTWGSTALGYGGLGGQAITSANTVIVKCNDTGCAAVYFGTDRLAYLMPAEKQDDAWRKALAERNMPSCRNAATLGWIKPPSSDE